MRIFSKGTWIWIADIMYIIPPATLACNLQAVYISMQMWGCKFSRELAWSIVSDLEHVANDEIRVLWNVEGMFVQDLSGDPMTVKIRPHWRSTMDTEEKKRKYVIMDDFQFQTNSISRVLFPSKKFLSLNAKDLNAHTHYNIWPAESTAQNKGTLRTTWF